MRAEPASGVLAAFGFRSPSWTRPTIRIGPDQGPSCVQSPRVTVFADGPVGRE